MSEYRKTYEGNTYFITLTVVDWVDIFSRREYSEVIIESLGFSQKNKGLEIYSYVIMTNHLHLIVSREKGKIGDWVRDFKTFTSKKIVELILSNHQESRKEWLKFLFKFHAKKINKLNGYSLWKEGYCPIVIDSNEILQQKLDYIHDNPVRAGFVNNPEEWRLSSANIESPIKILEL